MLLKTRNDVLCLIGLAFCLSCNPPARGDERTLYNKKSEFNQIIVRESDDGIRSLLFDENGAVQTAIDMRDPTRLVHNYARTIMSALAVIPQPKRILIVGLGGGAMPMFLRRNCPEANIDLAELDPAVFDVAVRFFDFREDPKMKVYLGDGRKFIQTTSNRYDIIFLDAYGDDSIPYMLATKEFMEEVKQKLSEGGIVVSNVWGSGSNRLYASMVRTYQAVFPELHIIRAPMSENRIHIAFPRKAGLTEEKLIEQASHIETKLKPPLQLSTIIKAGYTEPESVSDGKVLLDKDAPPD